MIIDKNFNINKFGKLLGKSWELKKKINKSSTNSIIDRYYKSAIKSGAYGGKLLGAGNGGFIMLLSNKKSQKKIIRNLGKLKKISIKFDDGGTRITYFDRSGENI